MTQNFLHSNPVNQYRTVCNHFSRYQSSNTFSSTLYFLNYSRRRANRLKSSELSSRLANNCPKLSLTIISRRALDHSLIQRHTSSFRRKSTVKAS